MTRPKMTPKDVPLTVRPVYLLGFVRVVLKHPLTSVLPLWETGYWWGMKNAMTITQMREMAAPLKERLKILTSVKELLQFARNVAMGLFRQKRNVMTLMQ